MALDIYGGDPRIIATQTELLRIASCIQLAMNELEQSVLALPDMFLDLVPNPIPNIQLAFQVPGLIEQLRTLRIGLETAAEGYYSTEAQITRLLTNLFSPVTSMQMFLSQPNPVSGALSDQVLKAAGAMAVVGLTGVPSLAKSQVVGQALRLGVAVAGGTSPSSLLAGFHATSLSLGIPVDAAGSARLLQTNNVGSANSIHTLAQRLDVSYWQPSSAIRIEVFQKPVGRDFVVYIPGTQSFLPGSKNPLNLQSNFTAMGAVVQSPSQQAVSDALKQLGAGKGDSVLLVGHSQGALIAGNIASSPQPFQVKGLISLGGPIGHLDLKVPVISVAHAADPVPLLSGRENPMRENWVSVSSNREFASLVEAHRISGYVETTELLTKSENPGYRRVLQQLLPDAGSGKEYRFEISRD